MIRFAAAGLASAALAGCGNQHPAVMTSYEAEAAVLRQTFSQGECRERITENNAVLRRMTYCSTELASGRVQVETLLGAPTELLTRADHAGHPSDEPESFILRLLDRYETSEFDTAQCNVTGVHAAVGERYDISCIRLSDGYIAFTVTRILPSDGDD